MSRKISQPSREDLIKAYEGNSLSEVARMFNTSNPTVRKWLIDLKIPRKTHKEASQEANRKNAAKIPGKESLYWNYKNKSLKELQQDYGVGQEKLYEWFEIYDIPLKSHSEACIEAKSRQFDHLKFDVDSLKKSYKKHQNIQLVADEFEVSYGYMKRLLKENGIEIIQPYRSQGEIRLFEYCQSLDSTVICNDKSIINPFELDIVFPNQKIAIEYCGLYWHSETFAGKHKKYHQEKYFKCKEKEFKLITVFEDDDIQKIESLIKSSLGMNERIFARKCKVQQITPKQARIFHKQHHLSNDAFGSNIHYGLIYGEELVMVMSAGHSRFNKNYDIELHRLTSHSNFTVVGGASRLLKKLQKKNVITYADLRFGDGGVYEKCGFSFKNFTPPNYWYFHKDSMIRHSRVKFQKHKLEEILENYNPAKTEYENMVFNKYGRIWDCGNSVYERDF